MPGSIKKLFVEEGEEVGKGRTIMYLWAMRMNVNIDATETGKIDTILVSEGQDVKPGEMLAVLAK